MQLFELYSYSADICTHAYNAFGNIKKQSNAKKKKKSLHINCHHFTVATFFLKSKQLEEGLQQYRNNTGKIRR